jgi:hypothetical protein
VVGPPAFIRVLGFGAGEGDGEGAGGRGGGGVGGGGGGGVLGGDGVVPGWAPDVVSG